MMYGPRQSKPMSGLFVRKPANILFPTRNEEEKTLPVARSRSEVARECVFCLNNSEQSQMEIQGPW